jgi:hypothetical protein
MFSAQHEQSPPRRNQSGNSALSLLQQRFIAHYGAKLLGSIVSGDFSRERKQSLSVASRQNRRPAVTARIASV